MIKQTCSRCNTEYYTDEKFENQDCPKHLCSGELKT